MIVIVDSNQQVIYRYEEEDFYPGILSEFENFTRKPTGYKHIKVPEGAINPSWSRVKYDPMMEVFSEDIPAPTQLPPQLSMDPSTNGSDALVKENENLKQRLIEQERQLNLIKSHLGL